MHLIQYIRLLAAAVNSLYSFWWDVTNDWGLDLLAPKHTSGPARPAYPPRPLLLPRLHSRPASLKLPTTPLDELSDDAPDDNPHALTHQHEHRTHPYGLRQTLLLPLPVYPFAILIDLVLRLTWSAKLSTHLHAYGEGDLIIFWIELAEVVRRWMWVFLRVEWEIIKDTRDRDATRTRSPPPPPLGSSGLLSASHSTGHSAGLGSGAGADAIAMERMDPSHSPREPIFEHDDFEMVASDISGHDSDSG